MVLLGFLNTAFGQLSDRVNSPSTFKVGTRPISGNLGLYFGISYLDIESLFDDDYSGIPLVNLKYYVTDDIVARMGFQISKKNVVEKGTIDPFVDGSLLTEKNFVDFTSEFTLTPGFEYHFTNSNLLDVYIGAIFPVGRVKGEFRNDSKYSTGEYSIYKRTKKSLAYGYEGFIGLQAFVADLPVAIGFDVGFAGFGHKKDKFKHEMNTLISGITFDQLYYSVETIDPYTKYMDLESSNFELEGNARITISYFFK